MATPASDHLNPAAPHHLPFFITAPGDTDVLMAATAAFLLLAVTGIGVLYLRLHALPEQMAHRGQKVQFELVAVLALLALFTHPTQRTPGRGADRCLSFCSAPCSPCCRTT